MSKSVTDEGVPSELDLGNVESPTEEHLNSLDTALDAAGVFDTPGDGQVPADMPGTKPEPGSGTENATPNDPPASPETPDPAKPEDPASASQTQDGQQKPPDDISQIDLDAIKAPEDISPRNLVNFDKLREVAKHYKAEASKVSVLERQVQELQQRAAQPPEEILRELEEHRTFRRIFDTENDPQFKKQFDERVGALDTDVLSILAKNGLPEDTGKKLQEIGLDKVPTTWWEQNVLPKLNFLDRERVQKKLAERADVLEQRQREVERFSLQRDEFIAQQNQQIEQRFSQEQEQIFKHVDVLTKNVPWARYLEAPANATPEQLKDIEAHNKAVNELETQFNEALYPQNPVARAEIAAAAVASVKLASAVDTLQLQVREANSRAEKLQKELDGIRSAGRAPSARPPGRRSASEATDMSKLSDEDAIERGLMEAEGV